MGSLRILGGDIVALVQHVELNESGWVENATAKGVKFLFWLLDEPADSHDIYALRNEIALNALTLDQVSAAIEKLIEDCSLIAVGTKFKLSEAERAKVSDIVSTAETIEKNVVDKVIKSAKSATGNLDIDGAQLWSLFRSEFIIPFIREFGARAYELITGQATNVGQKTFISEFLAGFDQSRKTVLEAMILSLLDKNDSACRAYILGLLNTHFYQTSVTLPPGVVGKVFPSEGKGNRLRLILDTNFIFSLFDLHSNPSNEAVSLLAKTIAKLPANIDVRMYVLPTTITEFRKSLIHYEDIAKNFRLTRSLVEGALKYGVSGVLETYFSRVQKSGYKITADDYFRPFHENIVALLKQHNVSILNGEDEKYDQDQATIDDTLDQTAFYKQKFINDPKRQKNYEQIWHDVLLWHFTADRRPEIADTVFDAEWVGVSIDYGLLAFDRFKRSGKGVPVLVHPASLVQALQLLIPSDENLERAILALMQMPFLFEAFNPLDEKVTQKILGTLSRFDTIDDLSPDTIIQILGNRALRGKIDGSSSREEEIELIRDAIVDYAAETEQKLAAALYEQEQAQERWRAAEEARDNDRSARAIVENEKAAVERQNEELQARLNALQKAEAAKSATIKEIKTLGASSFGVVLITSIIEIGVYLLRGKISEIAWWAPWTVGLLAFIFPILVLDRISRNWRTLSDYWAIKAIQNSSVLLKRLVVVLLVAILSQIVWELVKEDIFRWLPMLKLGSIGIQ